MKFSVLISVYKTEVPEFLEKALNSIWIDQTLKPNEIICVIDGPIPESLMGVIETFKKSTGDKFKVFPLIRNLGLGEALAYGLDKCSYDLVARMDTDDISHQNRFETQINHFKSNPKLDVLGSYAIEFTTNPMVVDSIRKVPLDHQSISKEARFRNPMNHPSVMYRKTSVIGAGGPKKFVGFDDYYLWIRMIIKGSQFANISVPLISLRAGETLIKRRSGLNYIKNEWRFQNYLLHSDFIGYYYFIYNIFVRILPRLLPKKMQWQLYNIFLRS